MKATCLLLGLWICLVRLFALPLTSLADDEPVDELVQMVVGVLSDKDKDLRALGLEQVRAAAQSPTATQQFAAILPQLPPEAQVGLLNALADRGDRVARPAVLNLMANSQDESVRVAAIAAVGFLGEPADSALLVQLLREGSQVEQKVARTSLVRLPGESVGAGIAREMTRAPSPLRVTLLEILTTRRALDTIPEMLVAAVSDDSAVRAAAMTALGQLAGPEHVSGLVQGVLKAKPGREREGAEKALMAACTRDASGEQRTEPLLAAMESLSASDRMAMLPTLGRCGGATALKIIEAAIRDSDPQLHDTALRALCNWPDASIASRLTELAQQDEHPDHRTRALRALIRVASLRDGRTESDKLELLRAAMAVSTQDAERNLVLQRAQAIRSVETLRFLLPYVDQPPYAPQACQSVVELAHHRGLRDANKAEFEQALDKVIRISQDTVLIDRANRYKRGQTWVRPIELDRANE
ncbi:MAG: HEAT repeat domain-containing protein [Pirellulaceae bacterium]